jgi:hypothetical protein
MPPHFSLGQLYITAAAQAVLSDDDVRQALSRHRAGDWGDVHPNDRGRNDEALVSGERLLSVYAAADGTRFWIITEADRSATTVLLPDDY